MVKSFDSKLFHEPSSEWENDGNECQNNKLACDGSGIVRQTRSCSIEPDNLDSGVTDPNHKWCRIYSTRLTYKIEN